MSTPPGARQHPKPVGPGFQNERTYLAWQRTGLSFAGVGALLLHVADSSHRPFAYLPGIIGLAVAAVFLASAVVRYRTGPATDVAPGGPASHLVGLAAIAASILGVGALVVIVTV